MAWKDLRRVGIVATFVGVFPNGTRCKRLASGAATPKASTLGAWRWEKKREALRW